MNKEFWKIPKIVVSDSEPNPKNPSWPTSFSFHRSIVSHFPLHLPYPQPFLLLFRFSTGFSSAGGGDFVSWRRVVHSLRVAQGTEVEKLHPWCSAVDVTKTASLSTLLSVRRCQKLSELVKNVIFIHMQLHHLFLRLAHPSKWRGNPN